MMRMPPPMEVLQEERIAHFNAGYIQWRKLVQKANSSRIKILRALERDVSHEASLDLGEKKQV